MSWGMTFEELDAYVKGGGSKGYAKGIHSNPSFVTFVSYNKKQASVQLGTRIHIVSLTHIRPVNGFRHRPEAMVIKAQPEQEAAPMSADKAPRPIGHKIGVPGAVPESKPAGGMVATPGENNYANNIVVIAARIDGSAKLLREARAEFTKVEADWLAMKALRDEAFEKIQVMEREYEDQCKMLTRATAALLTGESVVTQKGDK